jgi:hypothetical protein
MIAKTILIGTVGGLYRIDQSNVELLLCALAGGWSIIYCITNIIIWKLNNQREKRLTGGYCVWLTFVLFCSGLALFQSINAKAEAWAEFGLVRFPVITILMGFCIISAPMFVIAQPDRTDKLVFRFICPMSLSCLSVVMATCTILFACQPVDTVLRQLYIFILCCSAFSLGAVAIFCLSMAEVFIGNYKFLLVKKQDVQKETKK